MTEIQNSQPDRIFFGQRFWQKRMHEKRNQPDFLGLAGFGD
jgi:hypothetical protein